MGVIVPAAVCLLLTAAIVLGFVIWSTEGIDRRALDRETDLAARAVEQQLGEITKAQQSIAVWDDALVHVTTGFDKDWLDNNVGAWLYEFYGFEAAAVYSGTGELVYSTEIGMSPAPALFDAERETLAPLIAKVRTGATNGRTHETRSVLDIKRINGHPAVVSIAPIVSESGNIAQTPGAEPLHVIITYLDQEFANAVSTGYRLEGAQFTASATPPAGHASYALFDSAGRVATFLSWQPSRPGGEMLNQTLPALLVAFLVATAVVAVLLRRLWKSSSALEAERVEARHVAAHDGLTGLPNRARFEQALGRALGSRNRQQSVALMMLDLDRFKHINDTLGHNAGDELIRSVGQRLAAMVPPGDLLARLGGDEFAIVHTSPADKRDATQLARAIIEAIGKPFDVLGSEAFVGASIGLVIAGENDHDQNELTRKADIALYEAKARGRNRVIVYEEAMNELLQDRHLIEGELREALRRNDQLTVAFQPLFDGETGDIAGAEALVRWNHPKLGAVSPARFIPIAEGAGLIEPLGEFVLRRACELSARFPGRRIAVNISPAQLRNPKFPEQVFDMMVETAMRPSDLELEITEGILLDNEGPALDALTTFRKAGVRIALDDFGTGYSSLNYLKRYPVDCIKIDRSFVAQLAPGSSSSAIVEAMVTLAHALKIEVTAEGVETQDQLNLLKAMGCNLFQGFLLSPPVSTSAVEEQFSAADRKVAPLARIA